MADRKSRLQIHAEYAAVRVALGLLRRLPPRVAFWLTDRLGDLAYLVDGGHRRVALANMGRVLGLASDDPALRARVRGVFRGFLRVPLELHLLPDLIEERGLFDVIEVSGREHVDEAVALGKGAIVYSAHLGNWEAIAAVGEALGMKLHSVGRKLDNPLLDEFLLRHRSRYARSVVPKEGGLLRIARLLKDGCFVAMLIDQHAGRSGLWLDFLGAPASTFRAPADLAVRMGLPILGGFGLRVDSSPRFRLEFQPLLKPDPKADPESEVRRLTQAMSDTIGRYVLAWPEQWNWLHRRWRRPKEQVKVSAESMR